MSESVPLEYSSSYYKAFIKFLKTTILMEDIYGDFSEFDENLLEFCQNDWYEHDHFTGFLDEIWHKKTNKKYQNKLYKYWHLLILI